MENRKLKCILSSTIEVSLFMAYSMVENTTTNTPDASGFPHRMYTPVFEADM